MFVDLLRSPRIDSQPGGPVRQPYICRTGPTVYIPRNRFLGSINVYKYGLCGRDTVSCAWGQLGERASEFGMESCVGVEL